eukprot:TRINITY_DN67636_c8_g13_i1.p1 TRINITY_DN67636_c8_g13~~TRINITY_DN67636_c8_g13_i1.p1  ORF type:complete len:207 (-),score=10.09 TRINITY_DN67636_c8_g13_i1:261-881(-)
MSIGCKQTTEDGHPRFLKVDCPIGCDCKIEECKTKTMERDCAQMRQKRLQLEQEVQQIRQQLAAYLSQNPDSEAIHASHITDCREDVEIASNSNRAVTDPAALNSLSSHSVKSQGADSACNARCNTTSLHELTSSPSRLSTHTNTRATTSCSSPAYTTNDKYTLRRLAETTDDELSPPNMTLASFPARGGYTESDSSKFCDGCTIQ